MRKYKSKFMKPYIRRLKAGDLKRIVKDKEFGGMWSKISKEIIETAHSQNKQVYILTITGTGKILAVNTKKTFLKSLFGSGKVPHKEFNRQCNEYKNVAHNHRESERALKGVQK